jgi:hypothetical protein
MGSSKLVLGRYFHELFCVEHPTTRPAQPTALRRGRSRLRGKLSPDRAGLGTRRRKTTIKIANLIEQVRYS